ncbi:MAG TPA: glycosyltransferase family 2 protein [Terriglobia bacterium]|nr:glycosyltransferase family 2 protein [Terriglobia bacterium]
MPPISATIITRNEAANITRAIRSLAPVADEVIVVDAGSNDDTRQLAAAMGARVIERAWGGFASQKNFAAGQAQHDWVLSLDADEEMDATAQASIRAWKNPQPEIYGYRFARCARYLGRWIRHSGWYPDYKTRLYNRHHGRWVGDYVHESVEAEGRVETLPGEILHYTCDSLEEHRQRIEFYTDLAAAQLVAEGRAISRAQRLMAPTWEFLRSYFLRLGVLDGSPGFQIALMASRYVSRKHAKWVKLAADSLKEQPR